MFGKMHSLYNSSVTVTFAEIAHWLQEAEHAVLLQVALERINTPPAFLEIFNILNSNFLYSMVDKMESLQNEHGTAERKK